jgi:hypothetical protein
LSTVLCKLPKSNILKGKSLVSNVVTAEWGQTIMEICYFSTSESTFLWPWFFCVNRLNQNFFIMPLQDLTTDFRIRIYKLQSVYRVAETLYTHSKSTEDDLELILDNHISYCTFLAILLCTEHLLPSFPYHHMLQPLHKALFESLKTVYAT